MHTNLAPPRSPTEPRADACFSGTNGADGSTRLSLAQAEHLLAMSKEVLFVETRFPLLLTRCCEKTTFFFSLSYNDTQASWEGMSDGAKMLLRGSMMGSVTVVVFPPLPTSVSVSIPVLVCGPARFCWMVPMVNAHAELNLCTAVEALSLVVRCQGKTIQELESRMLLACESTISNKNQGPDSCGAQATLPAKNRIESLFAPAFPACTHDRHAESTSESAPEGMGAEVEGEKHRRAMTATADAKGLETGVIRSIAAVAAATTARGSGLAQSEGRGAAGTREEGLEADKAVAGPALLLDSIGGRLGTSSLAAAAPPGLGWQGGGQVSNPIMVMLMTMQSRLAAERGLEGSGEGGSEGGSGGLGGAGGALMHLMQRLPTNLSPQEVRASLAPRVCACVCVCVRERERERE